jgi:hypothetical protein
MLKEYIPNDWTSRQEAFYRRIRRKDNTGEQWTKKLIEFLWAHSNILWKDRCAAAQAPEEGSPDNSSPRTRQAAQLRVETAYENAPLMLAHDRRIFEVPLEERLQSRTSELLAWAKRMSDFDEKKTSEFVMEQVLFENPGSHDDVLLHLNMVAGATSRIGGPAFCELWIE